MAYNTKKSATSSLQKTSKFKFAQASSPSAEALPIPTTAATTANGSGDDDNAVLGPSNNVVTSCYHFNVNC